MITADELYGDIWCFSGCFSVLNQVSSYFSSLAGCCNSVLLWSPRNVLWTTKHNKTTFITSKIYMFFMYFPASCPNLKWRCHKCHNLALNLFNGPETKTKKNKTTQHETLLVVSPGSLHMNTSTENIVCVHRVYWNKVSEQLMLAVASSSSRRHGSPDVLGDRHVWVECMWFSWVHV